MSVQYILRTTKTSGPAAISARIIHPSSGIKLSVSTGIKIPVEIWNLNRNGYKFRRYSSEGEGKKIFQHLQDIKDNIECLLAEGENLDNDKVRRIIHKIVHKDKLPHITEVIKPTLNEFIREYIRDIESGARQTDKGTLYSPNTVKAIKGAMTQWFEFQKVQGEEYDFDEVDMTVYNRYTAWLNSKNYAINSIGKCISNLKAIMEVARGEKLHNNVVTQSKKFKSTRAEVDAIALTREDLDALMKLDCTKLGPGRELARDIFILGCMTAQRVSDYNHIRRNQIERFYCAEKHRVITVINIIQQKTKIEVQVPCNSIVLAILEKYDYNIPHLSEQKINQYIKEVAKAAGLTRPITITRTNGGVRKEIVVPKYELIHTHTARRTGATLMYMAKMDIFDIMKITGHTSISNLKKYIRADRLEISMKLVSQYSYFD